MATHEWEQDVLEKANHFRVKQNKMTITDGRELARALVDIIADLRSERAKVKQLTMGEKTRTSYHDDVWGDQTSYIRDARGVTKNPPNRDGVMDSGDLQRHIATKLGLQSSDWRYGITGGAEATEMYLMLCQYIDVNLFDAYVKGLKEGVDILGGLANGTLTAHELDTVLALPDPPIE